ncbi:MAG TPA: hypothetical protein VN750_25095 [Steroidobacteraceae bacterium]|nr:hypothetical protein [Steroidobacteraceae bacterium]
MENDAGFEEWFERQRREDFAQIPGYGTFEEHPNWGLGDRRAMQKAWTAARYIALVDVGNLMVENHWHLVYGPATGCRCGGCWSFQFVDIDDKIVHEEESLEDLMRLALSAKSSPTDG